MNVKSNLTSNPFLISIVPKIKENFFKFLEDENLFKK